MVTLTLLSTLALAAPAPVVDQPAAPAPRFEASDTVTIRGATNDIFAAGATVRVEEPVGDNAFLTGETVRIDSPIHGDLFAAGETLHIDAPIHGDVYAAGNAVLVGPEGRIDGHLLVAGSEVEISGAVGGSVRGGAGRVVIDAPIGGDVTLEVGELVFGDDGHVGGDLTYSTPEATPKADALVDGAVVWDESPPEGHASEQEPGMLGAMAGWAIWTSWGLIAKMIVGAVFLLIGGRAAAQAGRVLLERPSQSLGHGLVGFVLLPLVSLLACVTILPLPLGLLGFLLFGVLLFVGQLVTAQALGDEILRRFRPGTWGSPVISMAIGLVPLALLSSVPWIGGLVWLSATVIGGGAIWLQVRELARE